MPQAQPELKRVSPRPLLMPLSHKLEQNGPDLFKYLDKRVFVALNGSRKVMGTLRGYDVRILPKSSTLRHELTYVQVFLNVVLDDAVEEKATGEKVRIGMVVIRGNSVVMMEALDRIEEGRGGGGHQGGFR